MHILYCFELMISRFGILKQVKYHDKEITLVVVLFAV